MTPTLRVNITSNVKLNASMQLECNHSIHICLLLIIIILYVLLIVWCCIRYIWYCIYFLYDMNKLFLKFIRLYMGQCMRFRYWAATAHASLSICTDSTESLLLAYLKYGYRWILKSHINHPAVLDTSLSAFIRGICAHAIRTKIPCANPYFIFYIVYIDHDYDIVYTARIPTIMFCLFTLLLYVQSKQLWSWRTVSSPNYTFSLASLNKQLTSTSCTYFRL